jgi:GTP-binding protein
MSHPPAQPGSVATPKPPPNPFQQAVFFTTVNALHALPASASEVAFVGRSNAGKSSAINTIATQNRLAFVSKTPGRTQHINFFRVREDKFLVDLPGYGFARAPGAVQQHWEALVSEYLQTRQSLAGLVLIMDARHPMKDLDRRLLDWMVPTARPVHVLLTKCDKLSRQEKIQALRHVETELATLLGQSAVQLFSSQSREGLEEAIAAIWRLLAGANQGHWTIAAPQIKTPD